MRLHEYQPRLNEYDPEVLDILARAYDRALDALPPAEMLDREATRAVVLTGILDAAERGIRSEETLTKAALQGIALFEQGSMDVARNAGEAMNS